MLTGRRVLLIVTGGIAAYKSLEVIRTLKERGALVRCVLTEAAREFITPLSAEVLSGERVHTELFAPTAESEMGHIRLSRAADLVVVAPASADFLAKMAHGLADDLATTLVLATDKPVLVAPAMNVRMWEHAAVQRNLAALRAQGILFAGPEDGAMACGEYGMGRMTEPASILAAIEAYFTKPGPLAGVRALVTSGPTHEPIDPVRFIANRSSGKQGHAIAEAFAALGAGVTLIAGPTALADPPGVATVHVGTAQEMLAACRAALPADVAVCAAAVADWRVAQVSAEKLKKTKRNRPMQLELAENPDILATLSEPKAARPWLVIGFAAETERLVEHAKEKLAAKGCDWILANDVSASVFGSEHNKVQLIRRNGAAPSVEEWPAMSKAEVARWLAERVAQALAARP